MDREILLVLGQTGMGKSTWTHRFLAPQHRAVVMDPQGEYQEFQNYDDVGDMIDAMERPVFRVTHSDPENFKWLCDAARAAGRCWLVVEEAQRVMPAARDVPRQFLDVIYRGRHQAVSVLMVAQRPTTVHIAARSQWTRMIAFRQTERNDVDWMSNVSGFDLRDDLQRLNRGQFLLIGPEGVDRKNLSLPPKRAIMGAHSVESVGGESSEMPHKSGADESSNTQKEEL